MIEKFSLRKKIVQWSADSVILEKGIQWYDDSWILITCPVFFGLMFLIYIRTFYWINQFADYLCVIYIALFAVHVDKKWDSVKEKHRSRSNPPSEKKNVDIIHRKKQEKNKK